MIRIILADDHAIVREGLRRLFSMNSNIDVTAEASSTEEVMLELSLTTPDLLLLDLSMPGSAGIEPIKRIRRAHPHLPILILTMHADPHTARRALDAGASGYLTKDNEPETLLDAIRKVARGGRYIDPRLAELLIFDGAANTSPPHEHLTDREMHILKRLMQGNGIAEIAAELEVSSRTVSTQKSRLMEKLGVHTNTALIRYGIEWGLLE